MEQNKDTSDGIVKIKRMNSKIFISIIVDFLMVLLGIIFLLVIGIPVGLIVILLSVYLGVSAFFNKIIIGRNIPTKYAIVLGIILFFSLMFSHIIPYTMQLNDIHSVQAIKDDITLYRNYIKKYETEDKVLLEEWARQQAELTQKMSALGIQFASSIQPNNVIKKLSDEINRLINLIIEKELEVNHLKAKIRARSDNKWFFGVQRLGAYEGEEQ